MPPNSELQRRPRLALLLQNPLIPYVYEAAAAEGVDIVHVHLRTSTVPVDPPASRETLALDVFGDRDGALAELERHHKRAPFSGVLTLYEAAVPFAAELAARLGLPGLDVAVAAGCRDKGLQRRVLRAAGVDCPRHARVDLGRCWEGQLTGALQEIGLPAVVKPANGFAGQGVTRVDTAQEAHRAVALVADINEETLSTYADPARGEQVGALVEEYIDGREFSVETFTYAGRTSVLAVADKGRSTGPYFEEGAFITPPQLPADLLEQVCAIAVRAVDALGIRAGAAHTELRLRDNAEPTIIEVGARMGGSGLVHFMVEQSTGVAFARLVVRAALGLPPLVPLPSRPRPSATAANWIIPLGGHGQYAGLRGLADVAAHPSTAAVLELLAEGQDVPAWPRFRGYTGFVLSRHGSYTQCRAYHQWLSEHIGPSWTPAAGHNRIAAR